MTKLAVILGISGQDGTLLAKLLVSKGYDVIGTSRYCCEKKPNNLYSIGVASQVVIEQLQLNDYYSVYAFLRRVKPDELYNLSGQSSVAKSFHVPRETIESHVVTTLNILEAIRSLEEPVKFFNAGSAECFGHSDRAIHESMPLNPCSPYGVAKSAAIMQTVSYRNSYGIFASTGILFNHESPFRPETFATRKVIKAACRIAQGSNEVLEMGSLVVNRDWGWAEEYVNAMWMMLQEDRPDDFVIATGEVNSLQDFVSYVFEYLGLKWTDHVVSNPELLRTSEILMSYGDASKIRDVVGWEAQYKMRDVIAKMVAYEQNRF